MQNQKILERLKFLLSRELNVNASEILAASSLTSDLGADSLDIAEIALVIKDEFQYDMSDSDMQKIRTVGDMCRILEEAPKMNEAAKKEVA